ncbi:hypothetical protein GN244_ATG01220 [Phytophthora infestans]|uniref:Uncharacterized protein n=1 Tax=Phytophthora infestans TaxID=4787 RepID=A0A833WQ51_PHYIN|nr:hypothetical protein GN244_ATG01220 [Phytophthora infestans]
MGRDYVIVNLEVKCQNPKHMNFCFVHCGILLAPPHVNIITPANLDKQVENEMDVDFEKVRDKNIVEEL